MSNTEQQDNVSAPMAPSFTLGQFIAEAGRAIRQTLPKEAWVEAVILEAKPNRHGLSLELVDPFPDAANKAYLRCFVGGRTKAEIEAAIGFQLDVPTLRGARARLLLKPTFHARYHLESNLLDIDPALVESLVARRIEAIRRVLRDENLAGAQARLQTPEEITAVAVIHPDRAAGWADVAVELDRLRERGILEVKSYPTPFEGPRAADGIARALNAILANTQERRPDVILVVRGGGAAAALASLADLVLARTICRCPIPVITGLGHANDRTLLDDLAWRAADTPSKAVGIVRSILRRRCETAVESHGAILETMDRLVSQTLRPLLAAWSRTLVEATEKITANQAAILRENAYSVERHVIRFRGEIAATQADLDRLANQLLATAPQVPRHARADSRSLYAGIVWSARHRLPNGEVLRDAAERSGSTVAAFLERRSFDLAAALAALENNIRRRLCDEATHLTQAFSTVQALDTNATLKRGFVLPVDTQRRIIRSAEAARVADTFELLFTDGTVACRPVQRS